MVNIAMHHAYMMLHASSGSLHVYQVPGSPLHTSHSERASCLDHLLGTRNTYYTWKNLCMYLPLCAVHLLKSSQSRGCHREREQVLWMNLMQHWLWRTYCKYMYIYIFYHTFHSVSICGASFVNRSPNMSGTAQNTFSFWCLSRAIHSKTPETGLFLRLYLNCYKWVEYMCAL